MSNVPTPPINPLACALLAATLSSCSPRADAQSPGVESGSATAALPEAASGSATAAMPAAPASKFDLSHWDLTVPLDEDGDGQADIIDVEDLQSYVHPDFFYLDGDGLMAFVSPNKATTTPNSKNTRSELRQMFRGSDPSVNTSAPANNFALAAHPRAGDFAAVGGRMEATLRVNHVARNSAKPDSKSAYAVVIGQIHSGKDEELKAEGRGFGWGNEPLKIFYRKRPGHQGGSVFWTYELNLEKDNPKRRDIPYSVWGDWQSTDDPGEAGIALGEVFSYVVNVHENIMELAFSAEGRDPITYALDLSNNVDARGEANADDHPEGYSGDWHYFKAGAYNQCNTGSTACGGTGDWALDRKNGDYASVTFSRLMIKKAWTSALD